jgi:hypothetical protein
MPPGLREKEPTRTISRARVIDIAPLDAVGWLAEQPPEFQD